MTDRVASVAPPASPASVAVPAPPFPAGDEHPRFSPTEVERRWADFRSLLAAQGVDAAVVAGNALARGEIQFLTNVPVRWEALLVVTATDEPTLLVQLDNHLPSAAAWAVVPVAFGGPDPAITAADRLRAAGARRVGLLGPMSARASGALRAAVPEAAWVELGPAFTRGRLTKSPEELAWTRYGASICDAAVEHFLDRARPGMREDELGAILEDGVRSAGGQPGIAFLATASMRDGGAVVPNQTWSRRRTAPGDLAVFELSAGYGGCTGQVLRTVTLGAEPTALVAELHAVAEETVDALAAAIRPGLPVAELERIGDERITARGLTIVDDLVHGYGGGYLPPHVRTAATRRAPLPDLTLESGMLLVLQPNVVTADHRHGVQTGGLVVVTGSGAEPLHHAPRGLLTIGGRG